MCKWNLSICIKNPGKSHYRVLKTIFRLLSSLELTLGGTSRMSSHIIDLIFPNVRPQNYFNTFSVYIQRWTTPLTSRKFPLNATFERFRYHSLCIKMIKKKKKRSLGDRMPLALWFIRLTLQWYPCLLIYNHTGLQMHSEDMWLALKIICIYIIYLDAQEKWEKNMETVWLVFQHRLWSLQAEAARPNDPT